MSKSTSTRRDALRKIALGLTAAGSLQQLDAQAAEHVHSAAAADTKGGKYTPKLFNSHEWATITRLSAIVVPADDRSGSAVDAGAPQFIDLLCSQNQELAVIFTGGLSWFDAEMRKRVGKEFVSATPAEGRPASFTGLVCRKLAAALEVPDILPGQKVQLHAPIGVRLALTSDAPTATLQLPAWASQKELAARFDVFDADDAVFVNG